MHLVDDALHDLDRTRRSGHDPRAQRCQVQRLEVRRLEHGDEHRRHAVDRRAALLGDGVEGGVGGERLSRVDHRRPRGHAAQVADAHAEAVVQRHRDAHPIGLRVAEPVGDGRPVVEDAVVGEGGALGQPRRPARVLNVDGVVAVERFLPSTQRSDVDGPSAVDERVPLGPQDDDSLQRRQRRANRGHHVDVVGGLEAGRRHQHAHAGLAQGVGQLVGPIGRVDVDQDGAHPGGCELQERPLDTRRGPDADALALPDAGGQESQRHPLHLGGQLRPRQTHTLVAAHQREVVGQPGRSRGQRLADGLAGQGQVGRTRCVGPHCCLPCRRTPECLLLALRAVNAPTAHHGRDAGLFHLGMRCLACGADNRDGARFCDGCGAPVVVASAGAAETSGEQTRKT